jgi:hypothetical protein
MASRHASPYIHERFDEVTSRAERRALRRAARRQVGLRVAGLAGALAIGVGATAVGVSTHPTAVPRPAGAAEASRGASELTDLSGVELVAARRTVESKRPVDGVLVTHAAAVAEQQRLAAEAAAQAAAAAASYAEKMKSHTGVNWDGIATCETGGNWSMQGSSFSGGLGFANTTWSGYGGGEFAPNAGQATREEQIVVAERVYAEHGLSGWGCKRAG